MDQGDNSSVTKEVNEKSFGVGINDGNVLDSNASVYTIINMNEITTQRAAEFGIETQRPGESDIAFRGRVAGRIRDMGHMIEAHEAQSNMLYNDSSGDPMTGILGAVAQVMQKRDYHVSGENQIGCDIAAGHYMKNPPRQENDAFLMMAMLMMGNRD